MSSMCEISIDVAAIRSLDRQLRLTMSSLESDVGIFSDCTSGVAHARLRRSLNGFEDDWSDKRKKIREQLEVAADALQGTADGFEQADTDLKVMLEKLGSGDHVEGAESR